MSAQRGPWLLGHRHGRPVPVIVPAQVRALPAGPVKDTALVLLVDGWDDSIDRLLGVAQALNADVGPGA